MRKLWVGLIAYINRRNEMVRKNEAINATSAQLDVVIQRRPYLIPNLVETVRRKIGQKARLGLASRIVGCCPWMSPSG